MAVYEMQGFKYPAVSVDSASSARKDCADNFEYLNSFEEIVLCFDKDEPKRHPDGSVSYPGQEAAEAVAQLFPPKKVRILTLQKAKDANDYLKNDWTKEFVQEWWRAPTWTPQGIVLGTDLWNEISKEDTTDSIDYPFQGLNELTYGLRLSELVVITADTGVGKSQILRELSHYLLNHTQHSVGMMFLEETMKDTGLGIMSIEANKPLHLPDVRSEVSLEELKKYYDKTVNSERVILYDHFGSNNIADLLAKIRHMAAMGAKYIILDHLSIVVSDQQGDERKQLDEISTKIKQLTIELNICVIAVIHQNRQGQIRGTAGVEQLANIVIKLFRDKESEDPWRRNVTKVLVQKNRFCGRTGPACYLFYDSETGRLSELDKASIQAYESGQSSNIMNEEW
jgi:twinkle protein